MVNPERWRLGVAGVPAILGGQAASLLIGLVSSAVLARSLGPSGLAVFGVLAVVLSFAGTVSDLGLRGAVVREVARQPTDGVRAARHIADVYARLKLLAAVVVAGLLALLATPIVAALDLPPDRGRLFLLLVAFGVVAKGIGGSISGVLHGLGRFTALAGMDVVTALVTAVSFVLIAVTTGLGISSALVVGAVAAIAAAAVGYRWLPADWRPRLAGTPPSGAAHGRRLLRFGAWLGVGALLSIVALRVDLLLVNSALTAAETGAYALALALWMRLSMLHRAFRTALLPDASAQTDAADQRAYLRRVWPASAAAGGLLVLTLPLAGPLVRLIYGAPFLPAVRPLQILVLIITVDLVALPLTALAYPLGLSRLLAARDGLHAVLLVGGLLLVLPEGGLVGAAVVKLGAAAVSTTTIAAIIFRRLDAGGETAPDLSRPATSRAPGTAPAAPPLESR